MNLLDHYQSPLGGIVLTTDEHGLTGLWFEGQRRIPRLSEGVPVERETTISARAKTWLDMYFSGKEPPFTPPLHPIGTAFQRAMWRLLAGIPYGRTTTYGELARQLAYAHGDARMSAQAIGGAVSRNPIALIIPCHRVIGARGTLTGYAAGIDRKTALLELERSQLPTA